jgi:DNA-binding CsgD family transcriptional regulator
MTSRFYNAKDQLEKILRLRREGLSDAEISERLGISRNTIRGLVSDEKRKANA